MFLLIPHSGFFVLCFRLPALHSTMFLLIRGSGINPTPTPSGFTFHNVSINTNHCGEDEVTVHNFTFHNVSINTVEEAQPDEPTLFFTFHNVSINTKWVTLAKQLRSCFTFHNVSINTDCRQCSYAMLLFLYIPQCFY